VSNAPTAAPAVALVSGGPDSAVLLHHLADERREIHPLFVHQGLRWEEAEAAALRRFLAAAPRDEFRPLEVRSFSLAEMLPAGHFATDGAVPPEGTPDELVYIPGRNVTLLALAGAFAAARDVPEIALGPLRANPFPDATPEFYAAMAAALSLGLDHGIRIRAPFAGLAKTDVLLMGKELPLETTFSCIEPAGERHCGVCSKCFERRKAFADARLKDATDYARSTGAAEF
jgi:7-cyano-7-deazaguanine synthase